MTLLTLVGGVTLLLSTLAKLGALLQARINRGGGTAGWSWGREVLIAASYASWAAYGALLHDLVVALSGVLGVALSALLLWQAARYRMEARP